MPGVRTAAQLVSQVRDHIQQPATAQTPFCDGFATDIAANPTSTPILKWINVAYGELLETGIAKCVFTLTLVPGQAEYGLAQTIHEITHATLNGTSLNQTTLLRKDNENPGWQNYDTLTTVGAAPAPVRRGLPTSVYTYSDVIGFDPPPDQPYTVLILADDVPYDLANPNDTLQRIPARYHDNVASRAAWWISNMDVENPAAAQRMPGLDAHWKQGYLGVQKIAEERELDSDNQVDAGDYRRFFRRGGY